MSKVEIIKRPVEQVGSNIKKTAWTSIIESLILIILGILLIACSDVIIKILAYLVGAFFIVKGAYQIISYYLEKGQSDFFNEGLLSGIIFVLIGIVSVVMGESIASVFRVILGIMIIYEALVRINIATKLSSAGIKDWRYILVASLIMLVLGLFITFSYGAITTLVGAIMIVAGIVGIVGDVVFIKHINIIIDKLTK